MQIELLGPLKVQLNGAAIDVGGPKAQAVLVTLAHHVGEIVRLDTLFEALWGDDPPRSARNVIQVRVSGLRKALGQSLDVQTTSAGYVLKSTGIAVDASEFEHLAESAVACLDDDPSGALGLVDEALAMWRGDPVAIELDIRPLQGRLAALSEVRTRAQLTRLDARLRLGEHVGCCLEAEALVDQNPYREDFWARHMIALYRSGRQAEALGASRRARDLLVDELGVEPGPQLQTLHRQILEQDEGLEHGVSSPSNTNTIDVILPRDNLRSEPNTFVERPEINTVIEALAPGRVVTVVGTGGIGKSRCITAAARRCLNTTSFADGVWIIDLAPLPEDSDDVATSAAAAMGLRQQPGHSILETIVAYLDERHALLVLDNCEHVAYAAAQFTDAVAARCATTAILTASRIRLGLASESVINLERLPDGAAQQLLTARIGEAGAGPFADDECIELCAVLDNYPLAIELAAARTTSLTPSEIAARLSAQPKLLTSATTGRLGHGGRRHADLSTALDWSLDRLSSRSRATLDRATVFVSDFDLDSAEIVLSTEVCTPSAVVEDLGELVEHHLISRDHGRARFRVLEPIRQHLRTGATSAVGRRYADHFQAFAIDAARGLRGPDEAMWWDRWRAEMPHVREMVRYLTDNKDTGRLDSVMAQMAVTGTICAITEPGEWAVDALRRLGLDSLDVPGLAAAAAGQFAHLDLLDECDAILDQLQASADDPWHLAIVFCIRMFREPGEVGWAELLHDAADECGDHAMLALAKVRRVDPDMVDFADAYGNPTLRVFARQWRSAAMLDPRSDAARLNKHELYRISLTSNNSHTIAHGQMFMALQHCWDQEPEHAGLLAIEFIERVVRIRSPHWVWHAVEIVANMLAMVRIQPFDSEMLWAAVSASGRPPFARVTRDPTLPTWVASQLSDDERREAADRGSVMDMDVAAREARKAAERMSAA